MSIPVYITSIVSSPRCLRHVWLTQCIIISLVNYSRLVMYSFGFQHAFQRGIEASDNVFLNKVLLPCSVEDLKLIFFFFFRQCFEAATAVIKHMISVLAPSGLMRSSPDGKPRIVF